MARDRTLKITTYVFAGLAMMLNIRLTYSASPYALLRFKLAENLFSIFVRTMAGALELWCLPSMLLGNIIDLCDKHAIGRGHERRRFSDASKYDVNGAGLLDKLDELIEKAQTLHDKADALAGSGLGIDATALKNAASQGSDGLKEKAETLVGTIKGSSSDTNAPAGELIEKFEGVRTQYDTLAANPKYKDNKTNPAVIAVDVAYNNLKSVYDTMLNVKKANLLKGQVGELSSPATQLHDKARDLADAQNLRTQETEDTQKQELIQLATNLKNAVGATNSGLQQALSDLNGAGEDADIVEKAKEVINKYNAVKDAYGKVKAKEPQYQSVLAGVPNETEKYDHVETQFQALERAYNAGKCKAITPIFDKPVIRYQSIFWSWSNFFTFVILFIVFITGGDQGHVTGFYWVMAASGFVFGINMVFVYAMEIDYIVWYIAGENSFPIITSFMHYVSISLFGNRRKWNTDYIAVNVDMVISMCIALIAASLWTYCYINPSTHQYWPPSSIKPEVISPALMVIVGMGLVFMIYPAIAPGMIVPFYLIDKIEMVLLVMTTFPPLLFASLREHYGFKNPKSPICSWGPKNELYPGAEDKGSGWHWHAFDILIPLQISLAVIFIYSLHHIDSDISRSIINQPKMSTFLSIVFYMCHEILLAIGFPGMVGNDGAGDQIMLPVQYAGALIMVFGGFVCNGYVTEYKRHDPSSWPTEGMTPWNAFCFWSKKTSKNTNKILASIFTTDLRRCLLSFTQLYTPLHIYIKWYINVCRGI